MAESDSVKEQYLSFGIKPQPLELASIQIKLRWRLAVIYAKKTGILHIKKALYDSTCKYRSMKGHSSLQVALKDILAGPIAEIEAELKS